MAKEDKAGSQPSTIRNRKARHEYFIEDTYKAGLVLVGTEVKSLRAGRANISDAYARLDKNGEAWIHNMHINPQAEGGRYNPDPIRARKLLLRRQELIKIQAITEQKGLSLVPMALFFEHGFVKLELGIGRGKKLYDKREAIADRDREREARREVFGRG